MNDDASLYRHIVEQVPEAVIFADVNGIVRLWNRGAESVFGFARHEIEGKSIDAIIPEALRARHWGAYRLAVATGVLKLGNRSMPTRALHGSGKTIYVDLSFALVRDDSGTVQGAAAVGRDITERFLAEKAQKKRLAELSKGFREKTASEA